MNQIGTGKVSVWQVGAILRSIHQTPGITRAALSAALDINKSVVSHLTAFLGDSGWIVAGAGQTRNVPLSINPGRLSIAGVVVQRESTTLVVCDLAGKVLHEETWRESCQDIERFLKVVLPYRLHMTGLAIGALGVALPGVVDEESGILQVSQPLGIEKPVALPQHIGSSDFPVFYANDARCIGWGLVCFARETADFYLHYLSFVEHEPPTDSFARIIHGSAFFFGQTAFSGSRSCAGELRLTSNFAAPGNDGSYLPYEARLKMKQDPVAMEKYLDGLAYNLAWVATLMDVPKIFLYGALESRGSGYGDKITDLAARISYYPDMQKLSVEFPVFENHTIPLGAAGMAIERLLAGPSAERTSPLYRAILGVAL